MFKTQFTKPIKRIDKLSGEIVFYNNVTEVKKDGFKIKQVNQVLYGRLKSLHGYYWKYV